MMAQYILTNKKDEFESPILYTFISGSLGVLSLFLSSLLSGIFVPFFLSAASLVTLSSCGCPFTVSDKYLLLTIFPHRFMA